MAAAAQRPRRMPPLELVREQILPRLPPREPACLIRASLVCKAWADVISEPAFRRRLHKLHGTPPVLGFLHNWDDEAVPRFIHTRLALRPRRPALPLLEKGFHVMEKLLRTVLAWKTNMDMTCHLKLNK